VKAWQNHKGLAVTGIVDEATARSLNLPTGATVSTASGSVSASDSLAAGARGRAVAELQLALINRGFVPTGGVDGIFGAATRNALTRFQQHNGLSATGQADAATLPVPPRTARRREPRPVSSPAAVAGRRWPTSSAP
jgi:peptidoglycan hydrolase-like protein with peptidoglycan-binding domain